MKTAYSSSLSNTNFVLVSLKLRIFTIEVEVWNITRIIDMRVFEVILLVRD